MRGPQAQWEQLLSPRGQWLEAFSHDTPPPPPPDFSWLRTEDAEMPIPPELLAPAGAGRDGGTVNSSALR